MMAWGARLAVLELLQAGPVLTFQEGTLPVLLRLLFVAMVN